MVHDKCRLNHNREKNMTNPIQIINDIRSSKDSHRRPSLRRGFLLIQLIVGVAFLWLPQLTHAQCPQICDANDNTALGVDALLNVTTGTDNVALGHDSLNLTTTGLNNTAGGDDSLAENVVGFNNTGFGWHSLKQVT